MERYLVSGDNYIFFNKIIWNYILCCYHNSATVKSFTTSALCQREWRNCGLCACVCVYMQKMELYYRLEQGYEWDKNKLIEWRLLLILLGIKSVNLKVKFFSTIWQLSACVWSDEQCAFIVLCFSDCLVVYFIEIFSKAFFICKSHYIWNKSHYHIIPLNC